VSGKDLRRRKTNPDDVGGRGLFAVRGDEPRGGAESVLAEAMMSEETRHAKLWDGEGEQWAAEEIVFGEAIKAVYELTDGHFMVSANQIWLPGVYADRRTAEAAFEFTAAALAKLQAEKNQENGAAGGIITFADLQRIKAVSIPPR
jgi:hypothetical protein